MTADLSALLGSRVLATDTAEELGHVKACVTDTEGRHITRLQIAGHRRNPEFVEWADIVSIGPDAVMVTMHNAVSRDTDDRSQDAARGTVSFIGSRILSTEGRVIGTVSDVTFDETTGAISELMSGDGRVAASRIRSLGRFAVVVDPA